MHAVTMDSITTLVKWHSNLECICNQKEKKTTVVWGSITQNIVCENFFLLPSCFS